MHLNFVGLSFRGFKNILYNFVRLDDLLFEHYILIRHTFRLRLKFVGSSVHENHENWNSAKIGDSTVFYYEYKTSYCCTFRDVLVIIQNSFLFLLLKLSERTNVV